MYGVLYARMRRGKGGGVGEGKGFTMNGTYGITWSGSGLVGYVASLDKTSPLHNW